MLKIGFIGLGTISNVHFRAVDDTDLAEVVAVCDIDELRAKQAPDARFYTDYKKMLDEEDLDVVHVLLPHHLHDETALFALKKGVNVFLEKPISINYKRSKALLDEVEKLDQPPKLAVSFQNRLNKTNQELKRILEEEDQSSIVSVRGFVPWARPAEYYSTKTWRGTWDEAGSGTLINQAIHTLDLMHYIIGAKWTECSGMVGQLLDYGIEVEDTAVATFKFDNGAKGLFFSTNANEDNDSVDFQVITEKSRYMIRDNKLFNNDHEVLVEDEALPGTKIYYGPSHMTCIKNFYESIINDTDNYCTLESSLQTMEMVDAIKMSSDAKRVITREEFLNE